MDYKIYKWTRTETVHETDESRKYQIAPQKVKCLLKSLLQLPVHVCWIMMEKNFFLLWDKIREIPNTLIKFVSKCVLQKASSMRLGATSRKEPYNKQFLRNIK